MKYLFNKETIFATLAVFLVIALLSLLFRFNIHVLDPIKLAMTDVNFNDLAYSGLKHHKRNGIDNNITIINTTGERKRVAQLLTKLRLYNAKVIGLDVLYEKPMDPSDDDELAEAINNTPNLVLSDRLMWDQDNVYHNNYFHNYSPYGGYVNFVEENYSPVRYFSPFEKLNDSVNPGFPAVICKLADEKKYENLKRRNNQLELINYGRDVSQFQIIPDSLIIDNDHLLDTGSFRNKIVLIGYISTDSLYFEDKHFTPLNKKFAGKSWPDMNGVIIQANIISMIMNGQYIHRSPAWLNWMLAVLFTWIFMAVAIKYYIEKSIWFHIVTKVIQLLLAFLFIYIGILLYSKRISIDFSTTILAVVLAVDVLYFYDAFVQWLHKKYRVNTIFKHNKH